MSFIAESEKQKIADAVQLIEKRTSGEIVAVLARASDDYKFIPTLWAAVIAMGVPTFSVFFAPSYSLEIVALIQLCVFLGLTALFRIQTFKMFLIPQFVKHERAARLAREQFFVQGLHLTKERSGLLIFVSVAERYVEILADQGLDHRVKEGVWQACVDRFVADVKTGQVATGFMNAIETCGSVLIENYPAGGDTQNELHDGLIEI